MIVFVVYGMMHFACVANLFLQIIEKEIAIDSDILNVSPVFIGCCVPCLSMLLMVLTEETV